MNIVRLLGLPWMALSQRWRNGMAACFALLFAGAVLVGVDHFHDANGMFHAMYALAVFNALF